MCSCLKKINKIKQYKHQRNKKHIVFSFLRIPFDRVYNVKTVLLAILRHSSTLKVQPLYLQLCDQYSGYGTLHCYIGKGSCPGSAVGTNNANDCHPYHVWSTPATEGTAMDRGMFSGEFIYTYYHDYTYAFSVRCVLGFVLLQSKNTVGYYCGC